MATTRFVSIPGSERSALRGATRVGVSADEHVEVTVRLRRKRALSAANLDGQKKPRLRTYLTHSQLTANHGANAEDLKAVEVFAQTRGLSIVESSAAQRSVKLAGTAANMGKAFNVALETWRQGRATYRVRQGTVQIPAELQGVITGVFGLDNRPFAHPHFRRLNGAKDASFKGFAPPEIASLYGFPTGADGAGQVIGIIELGGGFRASDLTAYFKQLNLPKAPTITAVSVDGGKNAPSTPQSADGEVMLDIEVAASIAPGAKIVVYFAAGTTDRDFLDAITQAVHDETNNPAVISISWGGPESSTTRSFQAAFDEVLQSAAALGITVTVASGDNGAADEGPNEWDSLAHTDFPASSPFALACGATNIQVSKRKIVGESVWNQHAADTEDDSFGSSGGGVSDFFPVPSYQNAIRIPADISTGKQGRGVPDVCADGDPASGYLVRVDGEEIPIGGTSAVAPLWAALIALVNQKMQRRSGFINPLLYANAEAMQDVTVGNNKVGAQNLGYSAATGWDPCTGLGSPNGTKLLAVLSA
jgi:kumamolisin